MSARAARTGATAYNPREVEEALYGRADPPPERLVALICATNPTGRGLSRDDTARRYELKSALQSRLIERHGGEVGLVEDGREGFVLLRHRPTGLSASHARVESLSPRARAWVRLQLDLRTDHVVRAGGAPLNERGPRRPDPRPRPAAPRDPLAEAAAAVARFDYERAGAILRRAFGERGGDVATARALVGFLVDEVALYADALALEGGCDEGARRDDVVRGRWAFAASQLGDEAAALRHVEGLTGEGAAAVFVTLARASAARGALDDAVRHAVSARRLQPAAAGLADVEAALTASLAGRLRAEEDAAEEALARDDVDRAEALARAVLARWPESPRARAVVRSVRDARRSRAVMAAALAFEDALARGELTEAARHLAAMREHGADVAPCAERVERAKAARQLAARAQEDAAAAAVAASIGPDLAAWLPAFLALPPAARELVRRGDAARPWRATLASCEALTAGGDVAVGRAAEAATALQRAAELAARDPDEAVRLLAGHERVLDRATETQRAMQQVLDARRARAVARAEGVVARAEAARAAGRWEEAVAALDEVPGHEALPAALRARAEGARGALTKALAYEREAGVLPPAGSLEGAIRALRAMGAARPAAWAAGAEARWGEARAALRARLAERWHVAVVPNDGGEAPNACTLPLTLNVIADAQPGTRWAFVMSSARVVTLCAYDLARNAPAARAALAAGLPHSELMVELDGDAAVLRDATGVDLTLDLRAGAVRDLDGDAATPRDGYDRVGRVYWRGAPLSWAISSNGSRHACDRSDGARTLVCADRPVPVSGCRAQPSMFVRTDGERDWTVLDASGDVLVRWRAPAALTLFAAAPAPGGDGWVLVASPPAKRSSDPPPLDVYHLHADGRGAAVVARFASAGRIVCAYTTGDGACWVLAAERDSGATLVALRAGAEGVAEAWRRTLFDDVVVVPVEGGARALLVTPREGGFGVEPLTAAAEPEAGERAEHLLPELPPPSPSDVPAVPPSRLAVPATLEPLMALVEVAGVTRADRARLLSTAHADEFIARCGDSAPALLGLCETYCKYGVVGAHEKAAERLAALLPGDPRVAMVRARWASARGASAEAIAAVAGIPYESFTLCDRKVVLAILIRSHIELGAFEAAREVLPAYQAVSSPGDSLAMESTCAELPEPLDLEALLTAPSSLRRRRGLIAYADRALAAGDARGVIRAIVASGLYRAADTHANARACLAIFALTDATPSEALDALSFLARCFSDVPLMLGGLTGQRFNRPIQLLPEARVDALRRDGNALLALAALPFSS